MPAVEVVSIRSGGREKKCVALFDTEYFHLAIMSRTRFEELFGRTWEHGALVEVVLGVKHVAKLSKYVIVDVCVGGKTLKNIYVWLIEEDVGSLLPSEYSKLVSVPVDIILGSTILENYGLRIIRDEKGVPRVEV